MSRVSRDTPGARGQGAVRRAAVCPARGCAHPRASRWVATAVLRRWARARARASRRGRAERGGRAPYPPPPPSCPAALRSLIPSQQSLRAGRASPAVPLRVRAAGGRVGTDASPAPPALAPSAEGPLAAPLGKVASALLGAARRQSQGRVRRDGWQLGGSPREGGGGWWGVRKVPGVAAAVPGEGRRRGRAVLGRS